MAMGGGGNPLARRRRQAIARQRRTAPEVGTQWGDGSETTSPGRGTSAELDAAMGASGMGWWRRPGGEYGRHGGGSTVRDVFVCCVLCVLCGGVLGRLLNECVRCFVPCFCSFVYLKVMILLMKI